MATSAAENGYEIHLWSKPVSRVRYFEKQEANQANQFPSFHGQEHLGEMAIQSCSF